MQVSGGAALDKLLLELRRLALGKLRRYTTVGRVVVVSEVNDIVVEVDKHDAAGSVGGGDLVKVSRVDADDKGDRGIEDVGH